MAHSSGKGKRECMSSEESEDPHKKRKDYDDDDEEEEEEEDNDGNESDEGDFETDGHPSGVTTGMTKRRKKNVEEFIDDVITAAGLRTYENSSNHSRIFHKKECQCDKPLRVDLQGQDKESLNGVIDGFARYAIQAGTEHHYASVHIQKGSEFTDEHVRRAFKRSLNLEDVWLTRSKTPIRDERFERDEEFGSGEALWTREHTTRKTSSIGAAVTAKQSKSHRKK